MSKYIYKTRKRRTRSTSCSFIGWCDMCGEENVKIVKQTSSQAGYINHCATCCAARRAS